MILKIAFSKNALLKLLIILTKIFAILNNGKNKTIYVYFIKKKLFRYSPSSLMKLLLNKINIYCFVFTFIDNDSLSPEVNN